MAGGSIDSVLSEVTAIIRENPHSQEARREVERMFQGVMAETRALRNYTIEDFLAMMQLSILSVGYARRGISDLPLLLAVTSAIPDKLGVEILFPVIEENGKRRLWYMSDARADAVIAAMINGRPAGFEVLKSFGDYALFLSGIMPDILARSKRKGGVDVGYYEKAGSHAFLSVRNSEGWEIWPPGVLEQMAGKFHDLRVMMNEAGMVVGTPARQAFMDNLLAEEGIGDSYLIKLGPMKAQGVREGPASAGSGSDSHHPLKYFSAN